MGFKIQNFELDHDCEPFIILEAGINHCGNLNYALKMIDIAVTSGANAIKFQTFKAEEFCGDKNQDFTYISQGTNITESMLEMFKRHEFNEENWYKIKEYCDKKKIIFISTPQNDSDLELLLKLGIPAIKIGSDDLTNTPMINRFSKFKLPIILSIGMSNEQEIEDALEASGFISGNGNVALLVCTSLYPTESENINLLRISNLKQKYNNLMIGFSDHSIGNDAAIAALALGSKIFEKHFTLDHELPGPDHWFSMNPEEAGSWVKSIRNTHVLLGNGELKPSSGEIKMRTLARRSLVAITDIKVGENLSEKNIGIRRPGNGLNPTLLSEFIGKANLRSTKKGELIDYRNIIK